MSASSDSGSSTNSELQIISLNNSINNYSHSTLNSLRNSSQKSNLTTGGRSKRGESHDVINADDLSSVLLDMAKVNREEYDISINNYSPDDSLTNRPKNQL